MNTESLRNEVLVPAVAVATAVVSLAVQAVLRNR